MIIDFNGDLNDISMILVSSERYALGRRTYIVQWTCKIILNNLFLITNKDLLVMIRDLENSISYGDSCDEAQWKSLLVKLKSEVERRNMNA